MKPFSTPTPEPEAEKPNEGYDPPPLAVNAYVDPEPPVEPTTEPEGAASTEHDFSAEYVDQIRLAESAAQRSQCRLPEGAFPDELAQALELRIEANLAQANGTDVTRVGGRDPKVRELEAPYSKRRPAIS